MLPRASHSVHACDRIMPSRRLGRAELVGERPFSISAVIEERNAFVSSFNAYRNAAREMSVRSRHRRRRAQ